MAPEQVRGEAADARTDVWALGVLLYEMASGTRPFNAPTTPDLFSAILRDAPPPLPDGVPPALNAIIARCLEKDRERRWPNAREVHAVLSAIEAGAASRSDTWLHRAKRHSRPLGAAALLVLAAAAIGFDVAGSRYFLSRI